MMRKVRLELARDPDFPMGSAERGYEFVAPIDHQGNIIAEEWKKNRAHCHVRRFWGHDDDETGHVMRKPGGAWAFHYDIHGDADDDETGYRFDSHLFLPGEYVSIREHDDVVRTFRVASVLPVFVDTEGEDEGTGTAEAEVS